MYVHMYINARKRGEERARERTVYRKCKIHALDTIHIEIYIYIGFSKIERKEFLSLLSKLCGKVTSWRFRVAACG